MSAHLHLDAAGEPARIVSPFGSETVARQWAAQSGVTAYRVLPAQLPRVRV